MQWCKSSHSNPNGCCVELAGLPDGGVALRNSRIPSDPPVVFTRDEMLMFIRGAKAGEFDHLVL